MKVDKMLINLSKSPENKSLDLCILNKILNKICGISSKFFKILGIL